MGIDRLWSRNASNTRSVLPTTNEPVVVDAAVATGSNPIPEASAVTRRTHSSVLEREIRSQLGRGTGHNRTPENLPPKVSNGEYSWGRTASQLFKTGSKVTMDGFAIYCTLPTLVSLAKHFLSSEALNAPMTSLGPTSGIVSSNGGGNGYSLTFQNTITGFGALGLGVPIFFGYQKLFRGLLKAATSTGKHTTDSAAAENARNMLKYVLTEENIALMQEDQQKAAWEAREALKTNAGAIEHAKKFYDVSKLVSVMDQQYNVAKASFVDTLPLREVPGWKNGITRLEMTENLIKMTNDYQNPMTRQKVRANFFTHACRSIKRAVPENMKVKMPFNVTHWEVPDNFLIPEEENLLIWRNVPEKPNHLLYLLGLPGTGKSNLKRIAEYMDSPFFGLSFPDVMKGGYDSILSAKWSLWDQTDIKTKDNLVYGEQIQKTKREKCSNPIVNFDEPHFSDEGGVKKAFDNWGSKKNYSDCVGMPTNSDHFALVTANTVPEIQGNEILTPEEILHKMIAPIASRSDVALFGESSKQEIAKDGVAAFLRLASMVCLPMEGGGEPELNEAQQQELQNIFKACLPTIVDSHHKKFGALRTDSMMETLIGSITIALTTGRLPASKERKNEILIPEEGRQAALNEIFKSWIEDWYGPLRTLNPYQIKREEQAGKERTATVPSNENFMQRLNELVPVSQQVKLTEEQYRQALNLLNKMAPSKPVNASSI